MSLSCMPIDKTTIVNEVTDERFEEVHSLVTGSAQLLDNGRRFETVTKLAFQCALGKNSYSSGTHRIRLKLHYGSAVIGIRSRHIRVVTDVFNWAGQYTSTPSTYGWLENGRRFINGDMYSARVETSGKEAKVFELTLHCDERRLTMAVNGITTIHDEMEVDGLHAPFPWCLFVQLNRFGACLTLE